MSAEVTSANVVEQHLEARNDEDSRSPCTSRFEDNLALWVEITEQSKKREDERIARIREKERQETANLHKRYIEERQKKEQEKSQQQSSNRSISNSHGPPAAKQPRTSDDNPNTDWRQPVRSMGASNMTMMDSRFDTFAKVPAQQMPQTSQCVQAPSTSAMFGGFYSSGGMIAPADQQFNYAPPQNVAVRLGQRIPSYATPPSMNGSANCETPSSSTSTPMRTPSTATPQQQAATPPALEALPSSSSSAEEQFETNIIQNIGTLPQLDGNLFDQEVIDQTQLAKKAPTTSSFTNNIEPIVNQPVVMQMPACQFPMEPMPTFAHFSQIPGPSYPHVYPAEFMAQHQMFIQHSYPKRVYPPGFAPMSQQQQMFLQQQQMSHQMQMNHQNGYAMGVMSAHPSATVPLPNASQPPNGVYPEMPYGGYPHFQ
ncbi:unnamed protein product, partial [Mesorhabditis belari]|uniref:Uncharacterized protein n=1 Tax=Mesorhabditis belari TaxID=2138241 RepID=A0AAF3E910_9BILA